MNLRNIFIATAVSLALTACGLYKKYEPRTEAPANLFGTSLAPEATEGTSIARMSWRDVFTDPHLQALIEQVLTSNTDLASARLAVEKSQAQLQAARLAYLPALSFAPQGSLSSFDGSPVSKGYTLPLQLSWEVETFGAITNKKRAARAVLLQAQMYQEVVRANLISATAQEYYMLQLLDRQLEILTATDSLWHASLDTQKSLFENGKAYSTAVRQMEASYLDVKTQIVDTRRSIRAAENALCRLLAIAPQHIDRSSWGTSTLSADVRFMQTGVPASMLELRPDIRMANHAMEEAFYNTQAARAAFFPSLTLTGTAGWTNAAGDAIINPAKLLLNAVGQLTQPIFARGQIKANYRIARLNEQDMQQHYVQTVVNAGNEVNEAMADCQAAREKTQYYSRQVQVLREAYAGTHELMDNGKASYLEVLTAQESLLSAQLSEAMNMYDSAEAVIALYIALGGGGEK